MHGYGVMWGLLRPVECCGPGVGMLGIPYRLDIRLGANCQYWNTLQNLRWIVHQTSYTIKSDRGFGGSIYCSIGASRHPVGNGLNQDNRNSANCCATFSSGQQDTSFTPYASIRFSSTFVPSVPGSPWAFSALSWVSLPPLFPPFLA